MSCFTPSGHVASTIAGKTATVTELVCWGVNTLLWGVQRRIHNRKSMAKVNGRARTASMEIHADNNSTNNHSVKVEHYNNN